MKDSLKILFVEDVLADAELNWREIEKSGIVFDKLLVDTRKDYLEGLKSFNPDIIIFDYSLHQFDGMSALLLRNELTPLIPFILVTGSINEEVAVECMRAGADDYILKERISRLGLAVNNSLEKAKLLKEKKNAEEKLRKSELRLQKAQSIAHVGNWELDLSDRMILCSDEAVRIYGFREGISEFPLDVVLKIPLPEFRPILDEALDRLLIYNEPYEVEYNIKRANDHAIRTIISKAELVSEPDSEQVKLVGVIQDITDRKFVEKSLHDSEEIFRHFMEHSPIYVFFKDKDLRTLRLSNNYEKMLGRPVSELIGKNMYELFPSELAKSMVEDDLRILNEGKVVTVDEELNERFYSTIKFPIVIDDNPSFLAGYTIDITERKRAEEELIQSYNLNASLLKTIPFGMNIVDEEGNVLFQSENLKRLFVDEAVGEKCWDTYRDDKKQCPDCPLFKGITVGETEAYESHGVLGNRIFEINHTGMMYKGKKAMLEIFQDITDRKQSEEELILAKNKAEEGDKLKTAFLHNISHEIRTPMNAIVGFAALLVEPDLDTQTRQDYIEVIVQSSNHLLEIITDIVDISNIEANLVKIVKNEINVNSILKSLYNQFIPKAKEKKIRLTFETALSDSEASVLADSTKLNQILINLINNAMKFTTEGSIKICYVERDNFLEFCVSDTGIGIAEEYHSKIFERFYQVLHTYSKLYEGTGLGLAISKANVELMGGKIWLSSEPGIGTTFYFTIPYEKRIQEIPAVIGKGIQDYLAFTEKKKILVAEDIESNFKLISYFLTGANIEIIRAVNGKEAVEICLADKTIDLVLMDIKMPVMDGYTAIKLIRQTNVVIPIIAQTAYFDDKQPALEAGSSGFISKPFDKKGLLKIIHQFI